MASFCFKSGRWAAHSLYSLFDCEVVKSTFWCLVGDQCFSKKSSSFFKKNHLRFLVIYIVPGIRGWWIILWILHSGLLFKVSMVSLTTFLSLSRFSPRQVALAQKISWPSWHQGVHNSHFFIGHAITTRLRGSAFCPPSAAATWSRSLRGSSWRFGPPVPAWPAAPHYILALVFLYWSCHDTP